MRLALHTHPMGNDWKLKTTEEKVEAYFEGYRKIPDGDDPDFLAMESAGLEDLPYRDEEWPEAPEDDSATNQLDP